MTNNNKEAEQGTHFVQSNGIRMAYQEFGDAVGADAYCRDAADAATTAIRLVSERRELDMIA